MRTLKSGGSDSPAKRTDLKFIVSAAVDRCAANKPAPTLDLNGVEASVAVNAEEFTMVLAHLIRNAQDACADSGEVVVKLCLEGDSAEITVADDGEGMSRGFIRDRLFRPFDSTKGAQGMGIGAYQAREFARKLGGDLRVASVEGEGTRVTMTVPTA
jgi:signal transduction histidine kinase